MPKISLTDISVRALKAPESGAITYWDKSLSGFGVRVSQGGTKSFIVMHGVQRQRTKVGRYPILSLSEARGEAKRHLANITLGRTKPVSVSFDRARDEFITACRAKNKPRTVKEYERLLKRHFKLGRTHLSDISQHDLMRRINTLSKTPSVQNHAFVVAKIFFRWAKRHHYIEANPLADLSLPATTHARERVLTAKEVVTVYQASLDYPRPYGLIVSLLLLTGQRRGEIGGLKWEWIDHNERLIHLPATFTKNKRAHTVPYGEKAAAILSELSEEGEYVFPATRSHVRGNATASFNGWPKAKPAFDETLDGVAHWTLHDLRRTFDSTMASLEVPLHVSDKLLNHASGAISGVRATYNRYSYLAEMRDAIARFDDHLEKLLGA